MRPSSGLNKENDMKLMVVVMTFLLSLSSVFAGEMKEIDLVTRETITQEYYVGYDDGGYIDYMYHEIFNLKLEEPNEGEECLVVVTGFATDTRYGRVEKNFWVCINRLDNGSYTGYLLRDEEVQY
jgi:hypothetical protein